MIFGRKDVIRPLIHLLIWFLLVIFSFLAADKSDANIHDVLAHLWMPLFEAAIIFYVNYFVLVEKFILKEKRYLLFIATNALLIILFRFDAYVIDFISGNHVFHDAGGIKKGDHRGEHRNEPLALVKSFFGLVIPSIFALLVKVTEKRREFELEKKNLENMQLQAELTSLKYQLQPHFFFNALNNIYVLVEMAPERAQQAIHSLSKLMQYLLYDTNREKVDLSLELRFLEKYIDLMTLRYTDDVVTTCNFPNIEEGRYMIAPLLLISVIENGYKHGISSINKSKINFDISIFDNKFSFNASNTNYPKTDTDISGSGIGLENLRKRLELIYPKRYELKTEIREDIFTLMLSVDLN